MAAGGRLTLGRDIFNILLTEASAVDLGLVDFGADGHQSIQTGLSRIRVQLRNIHIKRSRCERVCDGELYWPWVAYSPSANPSNAFSFCGQ